MLWTRGVAARETLSYLDRRGIDAEPALFGAGLSRRQLSRDDIDLPVASQYQFLELAATEANGEPALHLRDALLLFRRLGVDVPPLSAMEFKLAYFRLAKRYHPDEGNRSNYEFMANINVGRETILKTQADHH